MFPGLVTSIPPGKLGDVISIPGPGIKQLSQLTLGPRLFKDKVRRWDQCLPRPLSQLL